ncbi:aromatic acid exporter family protein [Streptomyces desertarenae]|uniref:Aromatic acid exporter family protein n=1 Tax=Streptomyces desertarenae TaxID=2666184 RepID=A0ABW4PJG6_9ACTN
MFRAAGAVRGQALAAGRAARRAWREPGRERDVVVQSLKAALAAVVAWLVADRWLHAPLSFIAPWVAVVLVRTTVYQSLAQGVQQVVAITVGTVAATAAGMALGVPVVAMAVVLPVVLLLSAWPKLGDQGTYAATAALFTLAFGDPSVDLAVARVLESLLGAVVGVGVNMLILPPTHLRSTEESVRRVVEEAGQTIRSVADGLGDAWDHQRAREWEGRARGLFGLTGQARSALERSRESTRLNPDPRRRAQLRHIQAPYRHTVRVLEQLADYLADLTRTLTEASGDIPSVPRPGGPSLASYARFLRQVADAIDAYGHVTTGEDDPASRDWLNRTVEEIRTAHDRLRETLVGQGTADPQWMALYGSLLTDARRLADDLLTEPPHPGDGE